MNLRPYQKQAEEATFQQWADGNRSVLGVMPTGCGKTVTFASIIRRAKGRALVVAHRSELIWQAKDKIEKVTGLKVDVEMGDFKSCNDGELFSPQADVIVATVQTLIAGGDGAGRIGKFDPKDFSTLIIDEAHHSPAQSYRRVLDYFLQNPKLNVLGVTATPDRTDEEALGQIFSVVAFDYEILDAIHDGWLVPIDQQMVSIDGLDFSSIRTTAGDLNGADLAAVMESEKNLHGIADSTIDIVGKRRGIGFASSVNHARILSDIFNRHQPGMSNFVHGKTDKAERQKIVSDFAAGKVQWLWNCGVFTEGFDDSGVEVIAMARPTKSRSLYAQMAGRSTRPHEGIAHRLNEMPASAVRRMAIERSIKPSCLIIDFVGNSGKHKLMTTADILGGNVSDAAIEAVVSSAVKTGKSVRMSKELEEEEKRIEERKKKELVEAARKAKLVGKATYKTQRVDPFDILQIKPVKSRGWDDGKVLKDGSRNLLRNVFGVDPDEIGYTKGMQLVREFYSRKDSGKCTFGQAKLLKRYGFPTELSFESAKATIDVIAKNGWRKPDGFMPPIDVPVDSDNVPF